MRIVIDLNFQKNKAGSGSTLFFIDLMKDFIYLAQHHSLICLVAEHEHLPASLPAGITAYPVTKFANSFAGKAWWYRFGLPAMLKKARAERYITLDNKQVTDPAVNTCSVLIGTDLSDKPVANAFRKALRSSAEIVTISDANYACLLQAPGFSPQKIKRLPLRIKEPGISLTWDEKEQVKTQYAAGREYFLFVADPAATYDTLALLKAFSAFKKWQHSNMQLIITGDATFIRGVSKLLQHYKYREDVHVFTDPSITARASMINAAYTFVYPARTDHFPYHILQAVRAGTPVVCYATPAISTVAGTSVLYADPADFNDLSMNMQVLYKDEALHSRMIDDARTLLGGTTGNDMAEQFLEFLNLSTP